VSAFQAGLPGTDEVTRAAFRRLLLALADSKRVLGIRYSDWLLGAPSIEAGIAASSMAQDEWGHARLLYATLKDFGADPMSLEHDRDAAEYASLDPLDEPFGDWADVTVGIVAIDGALAVALEGILEGGYDPVEGRIGKMLGEEEFHRSLGEAWFRRLAGGTPVARERLAEALERMLPPTLRAVAPDDDAHRALADAGLTLSARDLRGRVVHRLAPLAARLDVELPEAAPLDERWDATRGRGAGHPAEEAVERARGDRNRALFVE
jgi:ring-1,2-phenylacetyl-CoA epoxidase subunit PaaC